MPAEGGGSGASSEWPQPSPDGVAAVLFEGGVQREYPDRPILAVGAVAVKDGKWLRGDPSPSEELEDARWVEIPDLSQ